MSYLYIPPTWRNVSRIEGSLYVGAPTSTCVYRRGGVWHNVMTAGEQDVSGNDVLSGGLLLFFVGPTTVPNELFAELSALEPADPSWSPGLLINHSSELVFVSDGDGGWVEISGGLVDDGAGGWTDSTGSLVDDGSGGWTYSD